MNLDDCIITCFCLIDELLPSVTKGKRLRERGPMPTLSDSEVVTMEVVLYDRHSNVGGGGRFQLSSWSRSFAANNVGIQSPKNHNLVRNAAAKKRMNPNQTSHAQPMINPSTIMITPAPPKGTRERYFDSLLY
jgi:hypothetical protein